MKKEKKRMKSPIQKIELMIERFGLFQVASISEISPSHLSNIKNHPNLFHLTDKTRVKVELAWDQLMMDEIKN